jgi:cystathionine gamma-synthase
MPPSLPWSKRSLAAQALGHVDPLTKAVVAPIHVATTFIRDPDGGYASGFAYGRPDNATVREAEGVITMLEEAAAALLFGSGMAAATAVFGALDPGDHVVAPRVMYWALRNWLGTEAARWGLGSSSSRPTTFRRSPEPCGRGRPSSCGSRRPRIPCGP